MDDITPHPFPNGKFTDVIYNGGSCKVYYNWWMLYLKQVTTMSVLDKLHNVSGLKTSTIIKCLNLLVYNFS